MNKKQERFIAKLSTQGRYIQPEASKHRWFREDDIYEILEEVFKGVEE